jgi:hypothetical protein
MSDVVAAVVTAAEQTVAFTFLPLRTAAATTESALNRVGALESAASGGLRGETRSIHLSGISFYSLIAAGVVATRVT